MAVIKSISLWFRKVISILSILFCSHLHAETYSDLDLSELGEVNVFMADIFQAHFHQKGDWMFAYHFEIMHMLPLAEGKNKLTVDQVLQDYNITPEKMDMHIPANCVSRWCAQHPTYIQKTNN